MSFAERVTRKWVVICDGCGVEDLAVSGGGERYPPRGWTELRTGEHACTGRCRGLIEERRRSRAKERVITGKPREAGEGGKRR